jgi:hypothetical protein
MATLATGGIALIVAASSWVGLFIAWLVTIVCGCVYLRAHLQSTGCACYGEDKHFLKVFFPWLLASGVIASASAIWRPALRLLPASDCTMDALFMMIPFLGAIWRFSRRLDASMQVEPFQRGRLRTIPNGEATVYFWGAVGCVPCSLASNDLIAILQVLPSRFKVAMAFDGYPNEAPRTFQGVTIIEPKELKAVIPFKQTPSLALLDGKGGYSIFEGLPNTRIGLGYMMRDS